MAIITNDFLPTLTIKNTAQLISIELRSPSNIIVLPKYVGKDYIQYSITECGQYTVIANTPWTLNLTYKFDFIEPYNKVIKYVPWDTDTTLLLHGNLTDVSGNNRVPNYSTNVVAKTDQQKINETSIWKPAGTRFSYDGCLLNDSGDWTVEFWAYTTTNNVCMFQYWSGTSDIGVLQSYSTSNYWYTSTNNSSWNIWNQMAPGVSNNTWTHWVEEKYQNIHTVYKNGVIASTNGTGGTQYALPGCETLFGGYRSGTSYTMTWAGYFDEIRLSKTARYKNAAFVAPTKKFTVEDRFQEVFEAPTTNLISSYSFDRKLTEDYSNKDDRDYNPMVAAGGSAVWYLGRHEKEQCLQLNGSSYFRTSYQSLIPKCHPFSISMWFKVNNTNNDIGTNYGSVVPLLSTLNAKNVSGIQVILNIRGQVEFLIIDNDATTSVAKSEEFYNDMRWHNLIVTYTGDKSTNGMKVYVDGVLQGQGTSSTYIIGEQEYLYMANRIATQTSLNGFIQELNIYDKVLNPQEISQINGRELGYIEITGLTKRKYNVDEVNLDLTGLEVTAVYTDGFTDKITSQCEISVNDMEDGLLTSYSNELTATYNYKGKIYTATMPISVIGHYLCLECVTPGTITLNYTGTPTATRTVQYSKDKSSWTTFTITTTASSASVSMAANEKYYLRGTNTTLSESSFNRMYITTTGTYKLSGNINTLLNYTYRVDDIPSYCYETMFQGTGITDMSLFEWPGKTFGYATFYYFCKSCTSLTKLPNKIAKAIFDSHCFYQAFHSCTFLVDASNLVFPNIELPDDAMEVFRLMFCNCTSLRIPPQLCATHLKNDCYLSMFNYCRSLRLSTTKSGEYDKTWRIPKSGKFASTTTLTDMFLSCRGDVEATPTFTQGTLHEYYVYNPDYYSGHIYITHPTTEIKYYIGGTFHTAGIKVMQYRDSGIVTDVTSECTFSPADGTILDGSETELTVTYYGLTATQPITVTEPDYLCFTANTADSTVAINKKSYDGYSWKLAAWTNMEYSYDKTTWNTYTWDSDYVTPTITLASVGDKVYFRGNNTAIGAQMSVNWSWSTMTGSIAASGDLTTLLSYTKCVMDLSNTEYCFKELFRNCTSLTTPPKLPSSILGSSCYYRLFMGCTSLTLAPELPATTLSYNCYGSMFEGCTALTTPPELPCTQISTSADACYFGMFRDCTSLIKVPKLRSCVVPLRGYNSMFAGCTSLQVNDLPVSGVAELPWTIPTVGTITYSGASPGFYMFGGSPYYNPCPGTRAQISPSFAVGSTTTYYTQNTPV